MSADAGASAAGEGFHRVARDVIDAYLASSPEEATDLGDHRFDDRLTDFSPPAVADRVAMLSDALTALDAVDDSVLDVNDQVDLEILRSAVVREAWIAGEWRPHERDPLLHLPGNGIYPLLARPGADPATRLEALAARLRAVPQRLTTARDVLHDMSRVHVETAISRSQGIVAMLGDDVDALLEQAPHLRGEVDAARTLAAEALVEHAGWLHECLVESDADPRLGPVTYAARLWYGLDSETDPDALLTRAESDLLAVEEAIAELAAAIDGRPRRPGQVREVLDRVAAGAAVTDATIVTRCREAVDLVTRRVRELDLVTVPADPVQVIVMPQSRRGVAVAYCDAPGPLEAFGTRDRGSSATAAGEPEPTFFAVAPAPAGWSQARVASFYREYNGHMLRNLAVHEAMPGHVLQLGHSGRYRGATLTRAAFRSGAFVEGWAVYAEELVAGAGLGLPAVDGEVHPDQALAMTRLKMLLRSTINAVLDVRVHARGMTEAEAMTLMTERGHQEEGEAAGKWRRAQLTSGQLATYYVGYHAVSGLVRDLRARAARGGGGAGDRAVHDALLAHGSPPPRHLRTLLDLDS